MGEVRVINLREWEGGEGVYIGRGSLFGNPFRIGLRCTRAQAIERYRAWASRQFRRDAQFRGALLAMAERVRGGESVTLACWCAPMPCHGDVLAAAIRKLAKGERVGTDRGPEGED